MATENLLMAGVQAGGDRQDLHERIRTHSMAAAERIKARDGVNDLLDRLKADEAFAALDFDAVLDPTKFVGRAPEQVVTFVRNEVDPVRARYPGAVGQSREVHV
jgi:adenylosuccinate lyase